MHMELIRDQFTDKTSIGKIFIYKAFFCHTLEDKVRPDPNPETPENEAKVYGETAIPAGTYNIGWHDSPHFGMRLPHVLNVPGYEYVLMHAGNTAADTKGCILVGKVRGPNKDFIGQSRKALAELIFLVRTAMERGEKVTLSIK